MSDEQIYRYLKDGLITGSLNGKGAEYALGLREGGTFYWWALSTDMTASYDQYAIPMESDERLDCVAPTNEQMLGIRPAIWVSIAG